MDPEYITSANWSGIGNLLTFFWLILLFAIGFGFNFLLAHAIIPSLIGSGHLPQRFNGARRVFYGGAIGSLLLVGFAAGRAIVESQVLRDIWGRGWI